MAKVIKLNDHPSREVQHEEGGIWATISTVGEDVGAKNCNVMVITKEPGMKPRSVLHYHPKREELFVVIEGRAKVIVNDIETILEPGMVVFVPAGETHYLHLRAIPMGDQAFKMIEAGSPIKDNTVYLKK